MTWVEVASDAVKIGLGAIIGALAALINTHLSHKHKNSDEYSNRRRDQLEEIMPIYEELSLSSMDEATKVLIAFPEADSEIKIDKEIYDHSKRYKYLREMNSKFNIIESRVSLLGYSELSEMIEKQRATASQLYKTETGKGLDIVKKVEELHELRVNIITSFANSYKNA